MTAAALWSRLSLRAKSLLVLCVPLVPLLVASAAIVYTVFGQRAAQRWVSRTIEVKSVIAATEQRAADSETLIKDHWLNRDPEGLRRFDRLSQTWSAAFLQLRSSVLDNPAQMAHVDAIAATRANRTLLALRDFRVQHPEATAPPAELLDAATQSLAILQRELDEMQQVENGLLTERIAALQRADTAILRVTFIGVLLGLVGGLIAAVSFSREFSRRISEMRENSLRLLRNEPPRQVRSSHDELGALSAHLDQMWGLTNDRIRDLDLARSELDHFFTVSLDMLCISGTDGRFKRLNPAWETTLGWTTEELLAQPHTDFIHPDDLPVTSADAARQAEFAAVVMVENRYRCKDGSYRWLNWKSVSRPELGLIFAAARDVTEQRRSTSELRERVGDLKELNLELEAFSYSVSHDLRAPLRHITGFTSFVERSASDRLTEQERRWLTQSLHASQRMGRLIDDLLAFSRMGRTPIGRGRVRLNDVVREARDEVSGPTDLRAIEWTIDRLPDVRGDAGMLRQAFVNLMGNAVKYTQQRPDARIEVGALRGEPSETVVFVRDNGVGFDMQYAHKLFGVFQRLHNVEEFEGTGIGLANVRRIVSKHGGRAWAEGAVNGGATFYISLPVLDEGVQS
jgi:PAS domain S-box-containing protein